ncbi:hypothetical protein ZOSMA_59G00190 [Zostera marina]|uniref:Uncharacterized protein n=1 Tax=Zostera marina TaxID=29655 RepID=A0A0K9NUJ6_ZOSMR|nr:hypothetical protein ZOSMA_59G00190 [Zostera marina]
MGRPSSSIVGCIPPFIQPYFLHTSSIKFHFFYRRPPIYHLRPLIFNRLTMPPYSPSSVLLFDGQGESPFSSPVPPPSLSVHDVDDRFDPIGLPTFWEDIEEVRGLSDDGVRQEEVYCINFLQFEDWTRLLLLSDQLRIQCPVHHEQFLLNYLWMESCTPDWDHALFHHVH